MENKVTNPVLSAVASLSDKVVKSAGKDWCFLWSYKPEAPANLESLLENKNVD